MSLSGERSCCFHWVKVCVKHGEQKKTRLRQTQKSDEQLLFLYTFALPGVNGDVCITPVKLLLEYRILHINGLF